MFRRPYHHFAYFNPRPPCGGRQQNHQDSKAFQADFNPRPPCGGRLQHTNTRTPRAEFQSTAPVWGPTLADEPRRETPVYFNPRPPCGGRLHRDSIILGSDLFQSTAPVWGPTATAALRPFLMQFQSTAPVWGPTVAEDVQTGPAEISIHGPRVGADTGIKYTLDATGEFQSTAPVWGPTWGRGLGEMESSDFNPRPPCGGRHSTMMDTFSEKLFQSTAPVWGPTTGSCTPVPAHQFQSTAPVWGPTSLQVCGPESLAISIHGPRVGADPSSSMVLPRTSDFNPRPPCGGRPWPSR